MNKRFYPLVLAACGCLTLPAICFGRLGETEEQLAKRYGQPIRVITDADSIPPVGEKELTYQKGDITVHVTLWHGQSVCEGYELYDGDGRATPIKGDVIAKAEAILDANSLGHDWARHPTPARSNPDFFQVWNRTDRNAIAIVWRNNPNVLEVTDMEFMRESNRAQKAQAAGTPGF